MTKKKIIGGLNKLEGTFNSGTHRLDGVSDFIYAQYDVETHPDPERINSQKTFTLYRFFNINKYKNKSFNLPISIDANKIKTIFLFGYRDDNVDKTFFVKKNKDIITRDFIDEKIGYILFDLHKKNDSRKTEIILVHYNDPTNGGLYIIFNTRGSDDNYNKLEKYLLSSPSNFIDDNNLTKKLKFSYLKNLIQFTDKYLPLPKLILNIDELNSDFSREQIIQALNESDIDSEEELKNYIKFINETSLMGGGKIKKKKLMNAGSNNSSEKKLKYLEKIKKFYIALGKTKNPNNTNYDKKKQIDIVRIALNKLSDTTKKIFIEEDTVKRNLQKIKNFWSNDQYVIDPYTNVYNKLNLLESLLFVPQEYVDKNSDSLTSRYGKLAVKGTQKVAKYAVKGTQKVAKYAVKGTQKVAKYTVKGTLGVIATGVALPLALTATPFYLLYYAYTKNNAFYTQNKKTLEKLTLLESLLFVPQIENSSIAHYKLRLLESLLFVPQEYVDKNSDSLTSRYGKLAVKGTQKVAKYAVKGTQKVAKYAVKGTQKVAKYTVKGTLGVIATGVALPLALTATPFYLLYYAYTKNNAFYTQNKKTLEKLTLLESLLFVPPRPQIDEKLVKNIIILVDYNNILNKFNITDNGIKKETGINKVIYINLIKSIKFNYESTNKAVLSNHINKINSLIDFFTNKYLYNKNKSFAKQIISLLEYIKEHINNKITKLIKDKEKEEKDRYKLRLDKIQKAIFERTKKLLEYKVLIRTFGIFNVNKIHKETNINIDEYKNLINAIFDENINKDSINILIGFFEKLRIYNYENAEKIINLLNNILLTNDPKSLVETTIKLVNYDNIVDIFKSDVVNKTHNKTSINKEEYNNLISGISYNNLISGISYKNINKIEILIKFFTEMKSLIENEEAKRQHAYQIIILLSYVKTLHN